MSIYSTLDLHSRAAADAALEAVIQVAEQDHREPDMDEAAIRLLEVIADYLLQCGRKKQPEFLPVGVCSCRHYHGQNLSWCLGCFWCGASLDNDEDMVTDGAAVEAA